MSDTSPFAAVKATPANHLVLYFYASVLRVMAWLESRKDDVDLDKILEQDPFLGVYFRELCDYMREDLSWDEAHAWWQSQIEAWEHGAEEHLPLAALKRHAGLAHHHLLALVTVGMVEEDSRFGVLYARLQDPGAGHRPTLELLIRLLGQMPSDLRPLLDMGLLEPDNPDSPRSEWALKVPLTFWNYCRGEGSLERASGFRLHPPGSFPAIDELVFSPAFRDNLARIPTILDRHQARVLVFKGMLGNDRLQALGAAMAPLGKGLLEVLAHGEEDRRRLNSLGPLCALTHAIPVFHRDIGPGETFDLPVIPGYNGPMGFLLGLEGGYAGEEVALTLTLPFPNREQRRETWRRALGDFAGPDLDRISERFHMPEGAIRRAAAQAVLHAQLESRNEVLHDDVREGCRHLNRQNLDALATPVTAKGSWRELIVGQATKVQLTELVVRCRHREAVLEKLGAAFVNSANRGVRVLFGGPSGTGKTLAAKILAAELGMDLYRVDLASVVSKYIGETEKNLNKVLARAEELDVILLLDEGDALMGNRTEVRSSNDRYANLETNFLLQRLEHYHGIILITTNARENIDRAFERRMDVVINFLSPKAEERLRIWRVHLPTDHLIGQRDLESLATLCELSGGQIRNAAMYATLIAHDQDRTLGWSQLRTAVRAEYRKMGSICPLRGEDVEDKPRLLEGFANLPN